MFGAHGLAHEWNEPTPLWGAYQRLCIVCRAASPEAPSPLCHTHLTAEVHAIGAMVKDWRGADRRRITLPRAFRPKPAPAPVQGGLFDA